MTQNRFRFMVVVSLGLIALSLSPILAQTPPVQVQQLNNLIYLPLVVGAPPVVPAQWQAQTSGITGDLTAISCPDDATCFALATDGTVIATTDGGNTWQTKRTSDGNTYKGGISCPNTTTCFAVGNGGMIITTSDGGDGWDAQSVGGTNLSSISCPDSDNCLAIGDKSQTYYTGNGGGRWTNLSLGTTPLYSVDCPNIKYCLMVGLGRVVSLVNGNKRGNIDDTGNHVQNGVSCPSPSQCLMVGNEMSNSGDNTMKGVIHQVNNDVTDKTTRDVGTTDRLNDIDCPGTSLSTCYLVGGGISKNGSQWLPAMPNKGSIFVSTDAGITWANETLAVTDKDLYALECPTNAQTCYAVGQGGVILAKKVTQ